MANKMTPLKQLLLKRRSLTKPQERKNMPRNLPQGFNLDLEEENLTEETEEETKEGNEMPTGLWWDILENLENQQTNFLAYLLKTKTLEDYLNRKVEEFEVRTAGLDHQDLTEAKALYLEDLFPEELRESRTLTPEERQALRGVINRIIGETL